ncbi:caspase domain-containing protein [Labrys sp. KB_33_2]|uniref:caspase family protein n=1 Tax=Labrys sp. KB_33_2 TaxID=3237479 RepID=UPI003F9065E6
MPTLTALVIGNKDYQTSGKLKNPGNDAHDISAKLITSGFAVTTLVDATKAAMETALRAFCSASANGDVGLFFFAGHGVQIDGENYLLAIDTDVSDETQVKYSSLPLNMVIDRMEKAKTSTAILILDACRNNPWERGWRGELRGLAAVYAPRGTLIAYSTSPGQVADDGRGTNGAYTAALLQHIDAEDLTIEAMFKRVRNSLSASTDQRQISWEHTSLSGEFFFNRSTATIVKDYGTVAINDKTFSIDAGNPVHSIITALKSQNWYTQNPAIGRFRATDGNSVSLDDLFVFGRNILQAADGSSDSACTFIDNFVERTAALLPQNRKAILDGILFEIFFDSEGRFRSQPKSRAFNRAFKLERIPGLKSSFDFIAGCLSRYSEKYYYLPGKCHPISLDVKLSTADSANFVSDIYLAGSSILRPLEPEDAELGRMYHTISKEQFEDMISQQMMIPLTYIRFTYSQPLIGSGVRYPYDFTVSKV